MIMKEITAVLLKIVDGAPVDEEEKKLARDYLTSLDTMPAVLNPDDEVGFRLGVPRTVGDHTIHQVSHFRSGGKAKDGVTGLTPGAYVIATTGLGSDEYGVYWLSYFPAGPTAEQWIISAGRWAGPRRAAEMLLADRVATQRLPG